jgi:hypothetical protein
LRYYGAGQALNHRQQESGGKTRKTKQKLNHKQKQKQI